MKDSLVGQMGVCGHRQDHLQECRRWLILELAMEHRQLLLPVLTRRMLLRTRRQSPRLAAEAVAA